VGEAAAPPPVGLHRVEHVMGMPIVVDVRDRQFPPAAVDDAFAWLRFVDATFSTYRADSEISRLDAGTLSRADAHPLVLEVLGRCERLRRTTDGYFDVRAPLPGRTDPSGLVKGWSVQRAAQLLARRGARRFAVNAGGDVCVRGAPPDTDAWRVGVQHPLERDRVATVLAVTDGAVATSGAYERGAHIVDPHTGAPPGGVLSVTVVGPDLGTADAYATAAFAMGERGPAWTNRLRGYAAMTILADETVVMTDRFASYRTDL
jgi:thiamine biosynthesis lipoprotein